MIRGHRHVAGLAAVWLVCITAPFGRAAADDPLLEIKSSGDRAGARYVWAVRRSVLYSLARWDPFAAEVPLSPRQAVIAAQKYLRAKYGSSLHLLPPMISLGARGVQRYHGKRVPDLWAYDMVFLSDSKPDLNGGDSLNVMVLLNGQVIAPIREQHR